MKNFKVSSSANGKVFRNGLYSTAILAAAIVLAVLINLLVGAIPKKYTEFDLSAAKMYTLGDSSRQLMQSLDQDVTVYYLCETGSCLLYTSKNRQSAVCSEPQREGHPALCFYLEYRNVSIC